MKKIRYWPSECDTTYRGFFAMISHLFNRCSKCCTSRKSGTGTLLFDGLYDVGKSV